jgi:hypothetical protein
MQLNLARVQIARGRGAATEAVLRQVLSVRERMLNPGDWRIAQVKGLLGAALVAQGRYAEAEPLMIAADDGLKPLPGPQGFEHHANRARLFTLYRKLGRPQEADAYR